MSKQLQKKLEATEMWFLRRMVGISWTAKKLNRTVFREDHATRCLKNIIRKRQAFWPCDEKRETRASCDNWNDRRKM